MAKKSMEQNEYGITPIIYFLYYTKSLDNSKELRKQFISKFVKAGADLNKMSILGSAKQMIEYYDIKKWFSERLRLNFCIFRLLYINLTSLVI